MLISVDEVDSDDFREKGRVSAKLKNAITEPTGQVRYMRTNTMTVPYTAAFMFSTNNKSAVRIPENDRRYNVANRQEKPIFKISEQVVKNELQTFAEFLLAHKADQDLANTILETEERRNMQALSRTSAQEMCEDLKNGNFESFWLDRPSDILLKRYGLINTELEIAQQYNLLINKYTQDNGDVADEIDIVIVDFIYANKYYSTGTSTSGMIRKARGEL
jgi:hypothetical protein